MSFPRKQRRITNRGIESIRVASSFVRDKYESIFIRQKTVKGSESTSRQLSFDLSARLSALLNLGYTVLLNAELQTEKRSMS